MSVRIKTEDGDIIVSGKGKDGKDGTSGIPVPQIAEVGQVLSVKAVDEEGRPTEWECVQSGGGSDVEIIDMIEEFKTHSEIGGGTALFFRSGNVNQFVFKIAFKTSRIYSTILIPLPEQIPTPPQSIYIPLFLVLSGIPSNPVWVGIGTDRLIRMSSDNTALTQSSNGWSGSLTYIT